jgi:hypothetical protein
MDFLDPRKQRQHMMVLLVGYVCIAIAIIIGTIILLYRAYGFGLGKDGQVTQSGLVYVSSAPGGAQIRLNGKLANAQTNARLSLISGDYHLQLERTGYRNWQRDISVVGGAVAHYDYPLLIPSQPSTKTTKTYETAPPLATQSPDRRWVLVEHPEAPATFDVFDLKSPKAAPIAVTLPANVLSAGSNSSLQLMEWSTDNQHVLLKHTYEDKTEFIMIDRTDGTKSLNLNQTLNTSPTKITLLNKKYDQYYVYDATAQSLSTATLNNPSLTPFLPHVLEYQPYGSDIMLYASSNASGSAKVAIDLLQGGKTYNLREVAAGSTYLLNMTRYNGSWFVALGASSENKVYIYKNPTNQLNSKAGVLTPIFILKATAPSYLAFSANAQFIAAEAGTQFAVYDAFNDKGYAYDTKAVLDQPQAHATWMDGDRLAYVSGGKLLLFDYDYANAQSLVTASPNYPPFFDTAYKYVDTLAPSADGKTSLLTTQLRTTADQ